MASEAPSPPSPSPPPPASPEPELAQLRRKVEKLERELRSCRRQVREVEKLLQHTERLYRNAESDNQELRTQVRGCRGQTCSTDPGKSCQPRAGQNPKDLWSQLASASQLVWAVVSGQARMNFSMGYMVLIVCPTGNGRIYLGGGSRLRVFCYLFCLVEFLILILVDTKSPFGALNLLCNRG